MNFIMDIKEMFKFYEILEKQLKLTSDEEEKQFISNQMKSVYGVLSISFAATVNEEIPKIQAHLEASKIDRHLLALAIGQERVDKMPGQGVIDFEVVEDIEAIKEEETTKDKLKRLVSHSFARNIEEATSLFIADAKFAGGNFEAWQEIKKLFPENEYIYKKWADYISKKVAEDGPIVAYKEIKKHVKNWNDMDVVELLDSLLDETNEELKSRAIDVFIASRQNTSDYIAEKQCRQIIKDLFAFQGKPKEIEKEISSMIANITNTIDYVAKNRKEYVEKGYKRL